MNDPKLSVLMALYNAASYVEEATKSVLTQDFGDFELIICDDGSTDDSAKIVAGIAAADKRIRILSNGKNRGYPFTVNRLLEEARGEWITTQDADDLSRPGRFGAMLAFLAADPEIGIVGSWIELIDEKGKPLGATSHYNHGRTDDISIKANPLGGMGLLWPTLFLNRQKLIVEQNLRFDFLKFEGGSESSEDIRFLCRAYGFAKVALVPRKMYAYRQHSAQLTVNKLNDPTRGAKIVLQEAMIFANCGIAQDVVFAAQGLEFMRNPTTAYDLAKVRRLLVAISKSGRMYQRPHNWLTNPLSVHHIAIYLRATREAFGLLAAVREFLLLCFFTPLTMFRYLTDWLGGRIKPHVIGIPFARRVKRTLTKALKRFIRR